MIWKVLFVLGTILVTASMILTEMSGVVDINNTRELDVVIGSFDLLCVALGLAYFYALGWSRKLFSKKATIMILVSYIFVMLSGSVWATYVYFKLDISHISLLLHSKLVVFALMVFLMSFALHIPLVLAFIIYCMKYDRLGDKIENSFWKFICFYFYVSFASMVPVLFVKAVSNYSVYNIWDFLALLNGVYVCILIYAFAFKKKIINLMFWKISSVIYVLLIVPTYLYISPQFRLDSYVLDLYSYNAYSYFVDAITVYIAYKYAFTEFVFKKKSV